MKTLAYTNILEGNWEEVKGYLQSKWGKLTDDDVEKIGGSYKKLIGKLQKLYGYKISELEDEVTDFFESSQFEKMRQYAVSKISGIKEVVTSTLDEYFQNAKQKTYDAEECVVKYTQENPFKVIGIAALTGLLVGCLLKRN